MLENGCYDVVLQRPNKPRNVIGKGLPSLRAMALARELATNMVDNQGYTFERWMKGNTIARLELDDDIVFIAIVSVEDGEAS